MEDGGGRREEDGRGRREEEGGGRKAGTLGGGGVQRRRREEVGSRRVEGEGRTSLYVPVLRHPGPIIEA